MNAEPHCEYWQTHPDPRQNFSLVLLQVAMHQFKHGVRGMDAPFDRIKLACELTDIAREIRMGDSLVHTLVRIEEISELMHPDTPFWAEAIDTAMGTFLGLAPGQILGW